MSIKLTESKLPIDGASDPFGSGVAANAAGKVDQRGANAG